MVWGTYKGEWKLAHVDITPELATEDDVEPGKPMLMIDPNNRLKFYETVFHPTMEWDSIVELVKAKRVYKYANKKSDGGNTEGPQKPQQVLSVGNSADSRRKGDIGPTLFD